MLGPADRGQSGSRSVGARGVLSRATALARWGLLADLAGGLALLAFPGNALAQPANVSIQLSSPPLYLTPLGSGSSGRFTATVTVESNGTPVSGDPVELTATNPEEPSETLTLYPSSTIMTNGSGEAEVEVECHRQFCWPWVEVRAEEQDTHQLATALEPVGGETDEEEAEGDARIEMCGYCTRSSMMVIAEARGGNADPSNPGKVGVLVYPSAPASPPAGVLQSTSGYFDVRVAGGFNAVWVRARLKNPCSASTTPCAIAWYNPNTNTWEPAVSAPNTVVGTTSSEREEEENRREHRGELEAQCEGSQWVCFWAESGAYEHGTHWSSSASEPTPAQIEGTVFAAGTPVVTYGRCLKVAQGEGKYKNAGCEKRATKNGKYKWYPGTGEHKGLTSAARKTTFGLSGGAQVTCRRATGEGEYTLARRAVETLTFTGCMYDGTACTSEGSSAGTIRTERLISRYGFIESGQIGVSLEPLTRGGDFAEFSCAGLDVVMRGSVIAPARLGKMAKEFTEKFSSAEGGQSVTGFENEAPDVLEVSCNSGPFEPGTLTTTNVVSNEEDLEVNYVL